MVWIPGVKDCLALTGETEEHCSGFLLTHARHTLQLWKTLHEGPVVKVLTSCPMENSITTIEYLKSHQVVAVAKSDATDKTRDSKISFYQLSATHMFKSTDIAIKTSFPANHVCLLSNKAILLLLCFFMFGKNIVNVSIIVFWYSSSFSCLCSKIMY